MIKYRFLPLTFWDKIPIRESLTELFFFFVYSWTSVCYKTKWLIRLRCFAKNQICFPNEIQFFKNKFQIFRTEINCFWIKFWFCVGFWILFTKEKFLRKVLNLICKISVWFVRYGLVWFALDALKSIYAFGSDLQEVYTFNKTCNPFIQKWSFLILIAQFVLLIIPGGSATLMIMLMILLHA